MNVVEVLGVIESEIDVWNAVSCDPLVEYGELAATIEENALRALNGPLARIEYELGLIAAREEARVRARRGGR